MEKMESESSQVDCITCKNFKPTLTGYRCKVQVRGSYGKIDAMELCRRKLAQETGKDWGSHNEAVYTHNIEKAAWTPQIILNDDGHCLYYRPKWICRLFRWISNNIWKMLH